MWHEFFNIKIWGPDKFAWLCEINLWITKPRKCKTRLNPTQLRKRKRFYVYLTRRTPAAGLHSNEMVKLQPKIQPIHFPSNLEDPRRIWWNNTVILHLLLQSRRKKQAWITFFDERICRMYAMQKCTLVFLPKEKIVCLFCEGYIRNPRAMPEMSHLVLAIATRHQYDFHRTNLNDLI